MKCRNFVFGDARMRLKVSVVLIAVWTLAPAARAETISGTILIKKSLTRRNVTPAVSVYQRGTEVKLGSDAPEDPLVYERSRVVIYLEGPVAAPASATAPAAAPSVPVQMAQLNRRFSPDLVVITAGSAVNFPNMDPIFHNVFSLSKAKSFDLGSYDKGDSRTVVFQKPGIVEVFCHLHPNMAGTIVVTPNRYYARPDATGQYSIPDVPPGQYTVVAWHKTAGFFKKQIKIEAGHDAGVDFFIPLEEDAK
jgi:plastocyanin